MCPTWWQTLIASYIDDVNTLAWAQSSRRSLHQLLRRPFIRSASVAKALVLADRAAVGVASNVTVGDSFEFPQLIFFAKKCANSAL